jgi:hypothetical protein
MQAGLQAGNTPVGTVGKSYCNLFKIGNLIPEIGFRSPKNLHSLHALHGE